MWPRRWVRAGRRPTVCGTSRSSASSPGAGPTRCEARRPARRRPPRAHRPVGGRVGLGPRRRPRLGDRAGGGLLPRRDPTPPPRRHRPRSDRIGTPLVAPGPGIRRRGDRPAGPEEAVMSLVETDLDDGVLTGHAGRRGAPQRAQREPHDRARRRARRGRCGPWGARGGADQRGGVFCAGQTFAERSPSTADPGPTDAINPLALFGRFRHSPKPYVGRIAGPLRRRGMGLAAGSTSPWRS